MKALLRRIVPKNLRYLYHRWRASAFALRFGYPGRKLIVIAVTGTNGKTTVVAMIGQLLRAMGERIGWVTTATIRVGDDEALNATKLTTADPRLLQSLLRRMVKADCRYAVVEASSEGLIQGRLNGIPVRLAVFTNLTPEHIESHGSFEAYAQAKERLFAALERGPSANADRAIIVNLDDPAAGRYLAYQTDRAIGCTLEKRPAVPRAVTPVSIRTADISQVGVNGSEFTVDSVLFHLPYVGRFNVMNALEAIAVLEQLGFPLSQIAPAVAQLEPVPGRLEFLDLRTPFRVLVDYAPEPASMQALYSVLPLYRPQRIIHVFGSCGGGRDRARRPILGRYVAERADVAIITNEDPYDEPPLRIIDDIVEGTKLANPRKAIIERVPDRREAILRALTLAKKGDIVVVTGKASEQWIVTRQGKVPWDDRKVIKELADSLPVDKSR